MSEILIFERGDEDFSTKGLGQIFPTACKVHEEQCGAYELDLEHPMDEDGKFELIVNGNVVLAPVPMRVTPALTSAGLEDRDIYTADEDAKLYSKATISMGSQQSVLLTWLDLSQGKAHVVAGLGYSYQYAPGGILQTRWVSNGNRILASIAVGDELIAVNTDNPNYYLVTTRNGVTGYVQVSKITYDRTESLDEETVQAHKTREQPFRIYRIEKDVKAKTVHAYARHVYYDQLGNVLLNCSVEDATIGDTLAEQSVDCSQPDHGFRFFTDDTETTLTADFSMKNMVDAQLDPDEGIAALANLRIVRDNYDVYFLKRSTTQRTAITYGQTMLGVTVDINEDRLVNRIIPVGKDADGDPLYIDAVYVDSDRNNDATLIRAKVIEYDIAVGEDYTEEEAKAALEDLAEADFAAGLDMPEVTVKVEFLQLGDTEEYAAYRDLDRLYLGDLLHIISTVHDVDAEAELNEYEFDCINERYISITVGVTDSMQDIGSVASFMIPNGAVTRIKIGESVGNASQLEGHPASYFATAGHNHDAAYLAIGGKAADADKLNGQTASYYATADHNHDSAYLKLTDVLAKTYPVGAVYLSEDATAPGTLFGGTWASMTPPSGVSYAWNRTA